MNQTLRPSTDSDHIFGTSTWRSCEERIEAFELAWRDGGRPAIQDFLMGDGPLRQALLVELVHADLEFRLKLGESVRVESYLASFPELAENRDTAIDLISSEYDLRRRNAEVSIVEYRSRFPEYAEALLSGATLPIAETRLPGATPTAPSAWPDVPGYRIVAEIGRGGMGIVYKARDPNLGRHVALKFLPAEFIGDAARLERFTREARTASALNHPHICTIHGLGEHRGRPFIVMEFIEGCTLQALLAARPPIDESLRMLAQAARALAAAHAAGVVHRDIKPENIMRREDGYVKVVDFGLARRLPTLLNSDLSGASDTEPGTLMGTVAYMSPEQARGSAAESASDIFSLGIVSYQLLTGRHPFESGSPVGMLTAITTRHPITPSLLNPEVTREVDGIVEAMLHKDPRLRPAAAALEVALGVARRVRTRPSATARRQKRIVHREAELAELRTALAEAELGRGSIVCVAGEPGIGKTTLVEDFLDELATTDRPCFVARGQCSERLAETEAYLPIVDLLHNLLRNDSSGAVVELLSLTAPTWHALAAAGAKVTSPSSAEVRAPSQQAMLRELRVLLEEVTRRAPVVLFLDDAHWADVSTVDLLAHLGQHCRGLRLLILVTFRPTELLLGPHPFYRVKLELQGKGACSEVPLGFLSCSQIDRFLSLTFPEHDFPQDFAEMVFRRTEGSPLFMADLLAYLRARGVIAQREGRWSLAQGLPALCEELPESVRSMIQRKLEQLADDDRRVLAAAAVQGHEFDSAVVAAALDLDPAELEERLQRLDRVHNVVQLLREREFTHHTISLRYAFVHVLYQQALYNDLSPSRRANFALALAQARERLETDDHAAAAELACLYEVGRDYAAAVRHFWRATENAARVFAHHEAISLAQRGLRLLHAVPEAERLTMEIALQTALGLQLQLTQGYAAPAAQQSYTRARELCLQAPEPSAEFPVLWGLWLCHKVRSELQTAQEVADDLLILARRTNDPGLALQAHQALGMTAFCRGEQPTSLRNVEQVAAIYDPKRHCLHAAVFGQDPGVMCKSYGAVALWLLGFPDTAAQQCERAMQMSAGLSPTTQAVAPHFAAMVQQLCGNSSQTLECAQRAIAIAGEHGLSFWMAGATVLCGWAMAAEGSQAEGLAKLRQGLDDWRATGSVTYETYYLGLLAEVLAGGQQFDEALEVLEEALALVERSGERFYEPELYRLRGEVLLARGGKSERGTVRLAQDSFRRSLEIARQQSARSLELRAAMSVTELDRALGIGGAGRALLDEIFAAFTEGFETADLKRAQSMQSFRGT
jgi:predicted ATPase/tRNA A-37 threonylcarbamoyl transferase component Bud32